MGKANYLPLKIGILSQFDFAPGGSKLSIGTISRLIDSK